MATQLYPFQRLGADFLAARRNALLADEMGLGKSAQAIAAADKIGAEHILVLTPTSGRIQWMREFAQFSDVDRAMAMWEPGKPIRPRSVLTVGWANLTDALPQLLNYRWDLIIADEAHYAKNLEAQRSLAFYGVAATGQGGIVERARRVWPLTGTPMPNHPGELFPMLRALFPDTLRLVGGQAIMTEPMFRHRYVNTVQMVNPAGKLISKVVSGKNLDELGGRLRTIMLRRRARDVLDLPPIMFRPVILDPGAAAASLRAVENDPRFTPIKTELERANGDVLAALEASSPHLAGLRAQLGMIKALPVAELVADELEAGLDKIVIFAWHRAVIDLIAKRLAPYGIEVITGANTTAERQASVDRFQTLPTKRVLIAQIIAAGELWTMTAARHLLFAEYSFTPKDMAQAAKRIHRISQVRSCLVRFAGLAGSLDEGIVRVLARKVGMIRETLNEVA